MGKQFGDLSYANFSPQYVGQDVEGIRVVAKEKHDMYNTNLAEADKLDILRNELYQKVKPEDAVHVKAAIDLASKNLEDIKTSGRWENASYVLQKTAKDLAMDNNVIGAVKKKQNQDANIAEIDSRIGLGEDKNGISSDTANDAKRQILSNPENNKTIRWNPETASYENQFQAFSPVKDIDVGAMVEKFQKDWKPNTQLINGVETKVPGYYNTVTRESVGSVEDLNKITAQFIQNNTDANAYMNQKEAFHKSKAFGDGKGNFKDVSNTDLERVGLTQSKYTEGTATHYTDGTPIYDANGKGIQYLIKDNKGKLLPEKVVDTTTGKDLNSLSAREKEAYYYKYLRADALFNYTNPSSEKNSYTKDKETYMRDITSDIYLRERLSNQSSNAQGVSGTMAPSENTVVNDIQVGGTPIGEFFKDGQSGQVDFNKITEISKSTSFFDKVGIVISETFGDKGMLTRGGINDIAVEAAKKINQLDSNSKDNKVIKDIFNIAIANGLTTNEKGEKLSGHKIVENSLNYLANINLSNKSVYIPLTASGDRITEKMNSGLINTSQMNDGTTTNLNQVEGDKAFAGINYSGEEPRFKIKITDKDKKETYGNYSIPNDSYISYLKPIQTVFKDVTEKVKDITKRSPEEIKNANDILSQGVKALPNLLPQMGVGSAEDLTAIGSVYYANNNSTIYYYNDRKNPGIIRGVELIQTQDGKGKINSRLTGTPSISNFIQIASNGFFENPETSELKAKQEKQKDYLADDKNVPNIITTDEE